MLQWKFYRKSQLVSNTNGNGAGYFVIEKLGCQMVELAQMELAQIRSTTGGIDLIGQFALVFHKSSISFSYAFPFATLSIRLPFTNPPSISRSSCFSPSGHTTQPHPHLHLPPPISHSANFDAPCVYSCAVERPPKPQQKQH